MRATIDNASFQPIHIVLETPEDVAKFYAILNLLPILCALDIEEKASDLRKFLKERLPQISEKSDQYWDKMQFYLKQNYGKM